MRAILLNELIPIVVKRRDFASAWRDVDLLQHWRLLAPILKEVEILVLLPSGGLVAGVRRLFRPAQEAVELVALDLEKVVDEHVADLAAREARLLEPVERLLQALRQQRPVRRVGLVVLRSRIGC